MPHGNYGTQERGEGGTRELRDPGKGGGKQPHLKHTRPTGPGKGGRETHGTYGTRERREGNTRVSRDPGKRSRRSRVLPFPFHGLSQVCPTNGLKKN